MAELNDALVSIPKQRNENIKYFHLSLAFTLTSLRPCSTTGFNTAIFNFYLKMNIKFVACLEYAYAVSFGTTYYLTYLTMQCTICSSHGLYNVLPRCLWTWNLIAFYFIVRSHSLHIPTYMYLWAFYWNWNLPHSFT